MIDISHLHRRWLSSYFNFINLVAHTMLAAALCMSLSAVFFVPGVLAHGMLAQINTPTPFQTAASPTPGVGAPLPTEEQHKSIANCDLCGFCQGVSKVPGSWQSCVKCLYPGVASRNGSGDADPASLATLTTEGGVIPTPDPNHYYTGFGCVSTQPGEFTTQMSSFFFSIIGGIAFLFFIYGSAVIATARSDPSRLNQGKRILIGSIVGLLFALMSVFIIRFIAQSLGLPGIQ